MSRWRDIEGYPVDKVESQKEVASTETQYMQALQELLQMTDEEFAEYCKKIEQEINASE